jgi:hypothetical protein
MTRKKKLLQHYNQCSIQYLLYLNPVMWRGLLRRGAVQCQEMYEYARAEGQGNEDGVKVIKCIANTEMDF